MLQNLRSNYKPPSQDCLSIKLLSDEAVRVDIKINNILEKADNLTLGCSIASDINLM
nr:7632_t:CDS:2 [Entrophospora candida]